jgi:hypothetical protein
VGKDVNLYHICNQSWYKSKVKPVAQATTSTWLLQSRGRSIINVMWAIFFGCILTMVAPPPPPVPRVEQTPSTLSHFMVWE